MSIMKSGENSNTTPTAVLYVGIDVAKATLAVNAGSLCERTIPNTPEAIHALVAGIRRACPSGTVPHFCAEHTGIYGIALADVLRGLGERVTLLPPARVRYYALSEGILAKTDPIDARIIREFAEHKRPLPTPPPSPVHSRLRQLARARELAVKQRTADRQELLATSDKDIRVHLRGCIRFLDKRIAHLETLIARTVAGDPATRRIAEALETIQGVGSLTAAVIVALVPELGTLGRRRAAALCGCAPYPADSGTHAGRRRTRAGREGVRKILYMPALSAAFHNPRLKPFYQRLRHVLHKPGHVPLVAVMRKLFVHMDAIAAKVLKQAAGQEGSFPERALDNNMSSETP